MADTTAERRIVPPRQADRPAGRVRRRRLPRTWCWYRSSANLDDSDLTTEEYNARGAAGLPRPGRCGLHCHQDAGTSADGLKAAKSAALWLYSNGEGEDALTETLGVITPWNTASDTTALGAMQVEQVRHRHPARHRACPTAAAARGPDAPTSEALQGGDEPRARAERTALVPQAALAAPGCRGDRGAINHASRGKPLSKEKRKQHGI